MSSSEDEAPNLNNLNRAQEAERVMSDVPPPQTPPRSSAQRPPSPKVKKDYDCWESMVLEACQAFIPPRHTQQKPFRIWTVCSGTGAPTNSLEAGIMRMACAFFAAVKREQ